MSSSISYGENSAARHEANGLPICGATMSHCRCIAAPGHEDEPHVCRCGGSWSGSGETFQVHVWPDAAFFGGVE